MGMIGYFMLLLVGYASLSTTESACPPKRIGNSCSCQTGEITGTVVTKVVCQNINQVSTLLSEIRNFRGYKIDVLLLLNLQLPYLPAGLFLGASVKELIIKDSVLANLYSVTDYKPSPFAGLEDSLEEFAVYSTKQPSKWYMPDMKSFKRLKKIEIVQSPIVFVGHLFAEIGEGSLESLTVAYSDVSRIHPQAFPECTNLKEVNFRGNFLPYMVRTMFPNPATHLKKIDLSDNKLFTLPEDMFDNMPKLEFLDLSQNEFKTFQHMPVYSTLEYFYISKNPFECGCDILPLKQLLKSNIRYNDLNKVSCKVAGKHDNVLLGDLSSELQCY